MQVETTITILFSTTFHMYEVRSGDHFNISIFSAFNYGIGKDQILCGHSLGLYAVYDRLSESESKVQVLIFIQINFIIEV
jgi:hypothetical protein